MVTNGAVKMLKHNQGSGWYAIRISINHETTTTEQLYEKYAVCSVLVNFHNGIQILQFYFHCSNCCKALSLKTYAVSFLSFAK